MWRASTHRCSRKLSKHLQRGRCWVAELPIPVKLALHALRNLLGASVIVTDAEFLSCTAFARRTALQCWQATRAKWSLRAEHEHAVQVVSLQGG